MAEIREFENLELMQTVRNMHLNPVIRKVEKEITPLLKVLEEEMQHTFRDVTLNETTKTLVFERSIGGGGKNIELEPILPTFEGIGVEDESGSGASSGINVIQLKDAKVKRSGETAEVEYNWAEIVGSYTKPLGVGTIIGGNKPTNYLFFKGANIVYSGKDIATVEIPTPPSQIMASIPSKPAFQIPVPITEIEVEGDVDSSNIVGTKLIINMNDKGGVTPLSADNFKGFFASPGDLKEKVKDPIDGKSFAFAQDSVLGSSYYTPYYYISGAWRPLKQDPPITYKAPGEAFAQGVVTIKPNEKILISDRGELNLDGLSSPASTEHFHGFFETLNELKTDVPRPTPNKSLAYVKHANGAWIGYQWKMFGTAYDWRVMAPISAMSMVDDKTSSTMPAAFYGIYKNDQWELDTNGIATLKPINSKTKIAIGGVEGDADIGEVDTIQLMAGKSYATIQNDKLFLNHPQRVITYTSEFEKGHNNRNYEGNIFYDENSKTWMGWGIPKVPGAVDVKWTRIAHPHMSDEVKDLSKRNPAKTPSITEGIVGDSRLWDYNGLSFMEKDDDYLPEELKSKCGGYVTTLVQDKDQAGVTIPQYRLQTLTADRPEGGTYVRRYDSTGSSGSAVRWTDWVRTSFSHADMEVHSKDPGAHKEVIKYYRATSFTANCVNFANQSEGDLMGGVRAVNCDLLLDNYGYISQGNDYMDAPYDGKFRVAGNLAFSGYNDKPVDQYPNGRFQVLVRVKRKNTTTWRTINQFTYDHSDRKAKVPPLQFETDVFELNIDDHVVINITLPNIDHIKTNHPSLYFSPVKSYFVIEDENTHCGSYIAETNSKYFGIVDSMGDVGIRVHHNTPDNPNTAIRVYGEKLKKEPTNMNKVI